MTTRVTVLAAALLFATLPALAQTVPQPKTSPSEGEKATVKYFTQDSVGDVQLGELGVARARNATLRRLAHTMVRDHTRSADDGLSVARQLGDQVAFTPGDDNQIMLSHLARYSGAQFDREYAEALVDAHKNDITTARNALEFVTTAAVRSYLQTTIAVDKRHLAMAEAAQQEVGTGQ